MLILLSYRCNCGDKCKCHACIFNAADAGMCSKPYRRIYSLACGCATDCKSAGFQPSIKRWQIAMQKAIFYTLKGRLLQCERRPFATH